MSTSPTSTSGEYLPQVNSKPPTQSYEPVARDLGTQSPTKEFTVDMSSPEAHAVAKDHFDSMPEDCKNTHPYEPLLFNFGQRRHTKNIKSNMSTPNHLAAAEDHFSAIPDYLNDLIHELKDMSSTQSELITELRIKNAVLESEAKRANSDKEAFSNMLTMLVSALTSGRSSNQSAIEFPDTRSESIHNLDFNRSKMLADMENEIERLRKTNKSLNQQIRENRKTPSGADRLNSGTGLSIDEMGFDDTYEKKLHPPKFQEVEGRVRRIHGSSKIEPGSQLPANTPKGPKAYLLGQQSSQGTVQSTTYPSASTMSRH
jgi:hypothetical protein